MHHSFFPWKLLQRLVAQDQTRSGHHHKKSFVRPGHDQDRVDEGAVHCIIVN